MRQADLTGVDLARTKLWGAKLVDVIWTTGKRCKTVINRQCRP